LAHSRSRREEFVAMAQTAPAPSISTANPENAIVLAPLTAETVAAQTDEGSYKRGRGYFRSGRIFNAVRRETTLRARCHGSSGGPYVVEATLAKEGQRTRHNPVTFSCNCPRGDFCKHVVALLLTWIEQPEKFAVRPPLDEVLASKTQQELIALIGLMLREAPDLESLLEMPLPLGGLRESDLDEAVIRRQIANALREGEDRWNGYGGGGRYSYGYGYDHYGSWDEYDDPASRIARKLEPVAGLADAHVADQQWRSALAVSACLIEELAPKLADYADENGDLTDLLSRADTNLAACLEAQAALPADRRLTSEERERLIDTLFTAWQTAIANEGLVLEETGPQTFARHATPAEQRRISDQMRPMLATSSGNARQDAWQKRAVLWFLSQLTGDAGLSDNDLLAAYRQSELWDEAVDFLLERGRMDEAVSIASRRLSDATTFLPFIDRLVATGDPDRIKQAITLVDDRLWEQEGRNVRDDQALREWLERRYVEFGPPDKALAISLARFNATPDKTTYDAVKAAAHLPGHAEDPWPSLRNDLIATLRKVDNWYGLIDIHLAEGDVAEALKALRKTEKGSRSQSAALGYAWSTPWGSYDLRVADAAAADFPDDAVRIYKHLADRLITARGRTNYQSAAEYLRRAMRTLERHNRTADWSTLITDVRNQNKTLRALREELDFLGLA
jgi:hypothetical protein